MTERQVCERIVADNNCREVFCVDCPLWGEWECLGMDEVALARAWLEAHPSECDYCKEIPRESLIFDKGIAVEVAGDELRIFGGFGLDYECAIKYCPMCGRKL